MKTDLQQQDVTITGKGSLTLPPHMRRALNLKARSKVRLELMNDGMVTLRPVKEVQSCFGILKNSAPYNPNEKRLARAAMGARAARR